MYFQTFIIKQKIISKTVLKLNNDAANPFFICVNLKVYLFLIQISLIMKYFITALSLAFLTVMTYAQPAPPAPLEQTDSTHFWWKIISVVIGLGLGIVVYMLLKKNPRKDAN